MPNPILRRRRAVTNRYPNLAAVFDGVAQTYLSINDNAALSMGAGVRMTLACWLLPNVNSGLTVLSKGLPAVAGSLEYALIVNGGNVEFRSSNGTALKINSLAVTTGVWQLAIGRWDGTNQKIRLNNGADNSQAAADMTDTAQPFRIGNRSDGLSPMNGSIDCVGLWKRALTDAECLQLYNTGVGLDSRDLAGTLLTGIVDYWDLNGSGVGALSGNNLTANGGVTYGAGKR